MLINPIAVDTAFTINRRGIYYTIVFSLCAHLTALYFLTQPGSAVEVRESRKPSQPLRVQIAQSRRDMRAKTEQEQLKEITVTAIQKKGGAAIVSTGPREVSVLAPRLRIDSESVRTAIRLLDIDQDSPQGISENGAVVLNSELLRQLNQSSRSEPGIADNDIASVHSSFSGGSWTDHIRLGDSCFRVTQADPLDPVSQETWYRIKCTP